MNTNASQWPSKIKVFPWRALHNAIPTNEAIFRRVNRGDPCCKYCISSSESVIHVLALCPMANEVWFLSKFGLRTNLLPTNNFQEWRFSLSEKGRKETQNTPAYTRVLFSFFGGSRRGGMTKCLMMRNGIVWTLWRKLSGLCGSVSLVFFWGISYSFVQRAQLVVSFSFFSYEWNLSLAKKDSPKNE